MSSALVRTALEFVDPEDRQGKSKKARRPAPGQEHHPYRSKRKSKQPEKKQSAEELTEENIRKLLALSKHTADPGITKKIVNRTVAGKPIADKIEVKRDEGKSILFPDE